MHSCACVCIVENNEKHLEVVKKYLFHNMPRGSHKAHVETKKRVCGPQRLGATHKIWFTPKRWLLIWNLVVSNHFSTWILHEPFMHMIQKVFFVPGQNTQHLVDEFQDIKAQISTLEAIYLYYISVWKSPSSFVSLLLWKCYVHKCEIDNIGP